MVPHCFGLNCFGGVSDGVGGWVSRGSPSGVELPCVARCRSRGFAWSQPGIVRLEGRVVTGRCFGR